MKRDGTYGSRNLLKSGESRKLLQALFSDAADAMFIADRQGNIIAANSRGAAISGYSDDELGGMPIADFLDAYTDTLCGVQESRFRQRGGSALQVDVNVRKVTDGTSLYVVRDLTERRRALEEIRASEEKYRRLVEATDSGYVILNAEGIVLDANAEFVRLTGRERREDVVGHTVIEWTAPHDVERNAAEVRKCMEQGFVRNLEIDYISPKGKILPLEINADVFQSGFSTVILTLCRDISVRRWKEDVLREREHHLRLLTENMMDVISQVDANRIVTYCSPSIERMVGYLPHHLIGHHVYENVHPEDAERIKREELEAIAGSKQSLRIECRYRNARGEYVWTESTVSIMYDSAHKFQGAILSSRDITERIKAEELAYGNKYMLSSIFRAAPWGIGVVKNRIFVTINDRVCEMTGYSREELIGKSARMLYASDGDYQFVGTEKYRQIAQYGIGTIETRWQRKDGQIIDILMSSAPIYPQDLTREVTFTVLDITSRKAAEAEKEKLQLQLLQSQKMESVGRLAGGVAHDFNNMLSVILGHTELAAEQISPEAPIQEGLKEIKKAAERSADLTRQLLAFARKQTISPVLLDLNEVVDGMLRMLGRLIGEDIELHWIPCKDIWPVKIDPAQVDQILANLAVNARDAIPGVGKITIETASVVLDDAYRSIYSELVPGEYVALAISDTGQGMTREIQAHLFEPYFTTKELGQGTGLGLATVYGIVKQNKGFIHVYSEPGQGTTFRIYLPRADGEEVLRRTQMTKRSPMGCGETILLVEDEDAVLNVTKSMLERQQYTVLAANSPDEALHIANSFPGKIHLLITDLIMPGMNGRDLAIQLKPTRPNLKCLFVSGYTGNVIMQQGVLNPGVHFLSKPFSRDELAIKVREIIGRAAPSS